MTISLDRLSADDFEGLLQQPLPARAGETALTLVVDGVWRCPYPTVRPVPGFSLFLRGPREARLSQGSVVLQHPAHGELEIFVTPIADEPAGIRYEAVFN